jgi:hypothetical protein
VCKTAYMCAKNQLNQSKNKYDSLGCLEGVWVTNYTTAHLMSNSNHLSPTFERTSASPILGGALSCRFTSHDMTLPGSFSDNPNRLHIKDERAHMYPVFAGCPSWAKPLLFQEYQVPITVECSIRIAFIVLVECAQMLLPTR